MVKTLTVHYPDTWEAVAHLSSIDFQARARMAMAVKLYELGTLTSGQAAELAGISRVSFLLECPRYGTPSVIWDQDELDAEGLGLDE